MPKPRAKKIQSRLLKRIYEERLSKPAENWFFPSTGMILMLLVSIIIATFTLNWASKITPPILGSSAAVSVVPIDMNTAAVTILTLEPKDADISHLTYNISGRSGVINSSIESIPVRNVGDTGFIPISRGDIEIVALFNDSTQKVVYCGKV